MSEHPHTFGWYCFVSKFDQSVRKSWGAPSASAPAQPAAAGDKKDKKKAEKKGGEKKDEKAGGKNAKQNAKEERLKKRQAEAAAKDEFKKDPNDPCADKFGDHVLNRSQGDPELRFTKKFTKVIEIDEKSVDKEVIIRARVQNSRAKGKMCFMMLREQYATIQAGLFVDDNTSKGMVSYASKIPKESIVEIKAKVIKAGQEITSCT